MSCHPLGVQPLIFLNDDVEFDKNFSILLIRPASVEGPATFVKLRVEFLQQGQFDGVGDSHVVFDCVEGSENKILQTNLDAARLDQ